MSDYPQYKEHFEVVLMRNGVTEDEATQDDFKRVAVVAKDPVSACLSDEVEAIAKADGMRAIMATKPGVPTGPEIMARRRALDPSGSKQWR